MAKRITIAFSDTNAALIESISKDLGQNKSQVVNELFNIMAPSLRIMADSFALVRAGFRDTGNQAFEGFLTGLETEFASSMQGARTTWAAAQGTEDERGETPSKARTMDPGQRPEGQQSDPRMVTRESGKKRICN